LNDQTGDAYFKLRQIDSSFYEKFQLPQWIKEELSDTTSSILDYGCGFGQFIKALKDEGYLSVSGLDIDLNSVNHCQEKGLDVKRMDISDLTNPFKNKFDVVILSHVIEHIPRLQIIDTLRFIKEQILEPEGKLLLAVPNAQSNTDCYWAYEDFTHFTLFTSGSLYYVLKASGFENIEFLDIDCTLGNGSVKKNIRKFFLWIYRFKKAFWNKVTCSSYHKPSPQIFSYEIKVRAS
jgi:SAM-dependent methyltransferase